MSVRPQVYAIPFPAVPTAPQSSFPFQRYLLPPNSRSLFSGTYYPPFRFLFSAAPGRPVSFSLAIFSRTAFSLPAPSKALKMTSCHDLLWITCDKSQETQTDKAQAVEDLTRALNGGVPTLRRHQTAFIRDEAKSRYLNFDWNTLLLKEFVCLFRRFTEPK